MTAPREVRVEELLSKVVVDASGERLGRLEEIRVEAHGDAWDVTAYMVGVYAMLERLSAGGMGRAILRTFGRRRVGYEIPWDLMDLSDPEHPRTTCTRAALKPFRESGEGGAD